MKNEEDKAGDEEVEEELNESEHCGPSLTDYVPHKKRKVLEFEKTYLRYVPSAEAYEKSFMHRDVITHVATTKYFLMFKYLFSRTDFILTASCDGHLKFWKKLHNEGIEFVKHFRCHLGTIIQMEVNSNGTLMCTISDDKSMKIFDVINFDMINMMKLGYTPCSCAWIHNPADSIAAVAVAEQGTSKIHVYDGRGASTPIRTLENLHSKEVIVMQYNSVFETVVSVDKIGIVEYWTGPKHDFAFPESLLQWKYKTDTDLYEFAKLKMAPLCLSFSPDGKTFVTFAADRKLRFFK
ncbi:unnamed protein product [Soboliphyme baturini]|uniref:WD_REPEATS_REGION domain-containing protein n=1 Tax=Soboliphyme baturini TaxID=241478 RepID=A0A183IC29_9BILA|nr:unnamed protein product [Soboliphyme baturini]